MNTYHYSRETIVKHKIKKEENTMLKKIENCVTIIALVLILWFAASWMDIIRHNNPGGDEYKNYASWNMIELVVNACHVDR